MRCRASEGHIIFDRDPGAPKGWEYAFELSRCKTAGAVLAWVEHLKVKTWMTPELLQEFIDLAVSENKIELPNP